MAAAKVPPTARVPNPAAKLLLESDLMIIKPIGFTAPTKPDSNLDRVPCFYARSCSITLPPNWDNCL